MKLSKVLIGIYVSLLYTLLYVLLHTVSSQALESIWGLSYGYLYQQSSFLSLDIEENQAEGEMMTLSWDLHKYKSSSSIGYGFGLGLTFPMQNYTGYADSTNSVEKYYFEIKPQLDKNDIPSIWGSMNMSYKALLTSNCYFRFISALGLSFGEYSMNLVGATLTEASSSSSKVTTDINYRYYEYKGIGIGSFVRVWAGLSYKFTKWNVSIGTGIRRTLKQIFISNTDDDDLKTLSSDSWFLLEDKSRVFGRLENLDYLYGFLGLVSSW